MVASYFVWGAGAWRELDAATGAVRGWRRRARFVLVRRGRLQLARRRPVLRALRALARGEPSAAADGPRLAHVSKEQSHRAALSARPRAAPAASASAPLLHHCCNHYNGCRSSYSSASVARDTSTQPAPAAGARPHAHSVNVAGAQVNPQSVPAAGARAGAQAEAAPPQGGVTLSLARGALSSAEEFRAPPRPPPRPGPRRARPRAAQLHRDAMDLLRTTPVQSPSEPGASPPPAKRARPSPDSAEEDCKELVISEEDLTALRGFVERNHSSALQRFDEDERYRLALCYAVNPLVTLSHCSQLEELQRRQAAGRAPAGKKKQPEPQPSTSREARARPRATPSQRSEAAGDTQGPPAQRESRTKLPPSKHVSPPSEPPAKRESATKVAAPKPPPAVEPPPPASRPLPPPVARAHTAISKKPSGARSKEYSSLEDHCIVSWVVCGARASQVNGNRLWQELQQQYPSLTGQERSWHSLRNRYLRYILPALGALGLPPADVSRLRAAAATGVMRAGSRAGGRRASIFQQEDVRSASGRRPRPPAAPDSPAAPAAPARPPDSGDSEGTQSRPRPPAVQTRPPPRSSPRLSAAPSRHNGVAAGSSESESSDDESPIVNNKKKSPRSGRSPRQPPSASSDSEHDARSDKDAPGQRRSLRYSDVTRQFAARRRGVTSATSDTSGTPRPAARPGRPSRTSCTYKEASDSSDDFAPKKLTRSRKLYNPNAKL